MGILQGKIALITGASKGIGKGIANVFAEEGASLILVSRSVATEDVAKELRGKGCDAIAARADISKPEEVKKAVAKGIDHFGTIDILVNNAGIIKLRPFEEITLEDRDEIFDTNIKGPWNVTKEVVPYLKNKNGRIIVMSSVTGDMVADPEEVAYATSKAALIGFTKSLAIELAPYNITVNAICPGLIMTQMVESVAIMADKNNPDAVLEAMANGVPLKRIGTPKEVGRLAAFLASPGASYITGAQVNIDGGSTLPESVG